ncbi:hypothetical protein [Pseudorhodoferax sp. Leaf265]|uniref:hypothetical protein n=1 Tax=Pseudorhodoferax sp. Leaf265 TaxID=1736315 RepID=UPI0012E7E68A|nr:hypothetical protein [Pseudorhodoferax sp. Leaf265]
MTRRDLSPLTPEETAVSWARCAAGVLLGNAGMAVRRHRTDAKRVQALRLAVAALRFAGETDLADDTQQRADDLGAAP